VYSIRIDSLATDTVETTFFTGNRTVSYGRIGARPDQSDILKFDGGLEVMNPGPQARVVSLTAIVNETIREKVCAISSLDLAPNDSVKIEQPDSNTIRLVSHGSAGDYDLELNYVTGGGIGRFGTENIPLSANTAHSIAPEWETVGGGTLRILVDRGNDGTIDDTLSVQNLLSGTGNREGSVLPGEFRLEQNYPNPFNPSTTIRYQVPVSGHISLKVYDMLGREIVTLVDRVEEPGYKSVRWDATGHASGIYYCRLQGGGFADTRKLLLVH
jgi:hypothetical protein